ncbi:MAG: elongation factor P, partial [Acidobacteria bacterium]|nr:elongation factor P [Acidobacteriota bacterium]
MGVIVSNQVRKGIKLLIDGDAYEVVDVDHVKPGKGSAFARARVRNLRTGQVLEKTYKAGDKVETADTQERKMAFLYKDHEGFHFMDQSNYEQVVINEETVGESSVYLAENTEVSVLFHGDEAIGIDLPNFVTLEIIDTEPGFKGDTVSGGKPAKCNTGAVV